MNLSPHTSLPPLAMPQPGATKETAQIHRLPGRLAHVARAMGFGRPNPRGTGWLYSLIEEQQAREESERQKRDKKQLFNHRRGSNPRRPLDVELSDVVSNDPLDEVERILFRAALRMTETATELHRAAQLMKAKRLEWEAYLMRSAREEQGS